jgi:large subunit ribosomal protein L19
MDKLSVFNAKHVPENRFSDLRVGWTVKVSQKVKEGEKAKNTSFEGIIIAKKHGGQSGATITVRKASGGYGVEKTIPLRLPTIEKIEVLKKGVVGRAKLYYLREKSAREIRKKTRLQAVEAQTEAAPEAVATQ